MFGTLSQDSPDCAYGCVFLNTLRYCQILSDILEYCSIWRRLPDFTGNSYIFLNMLEYCVGLLQYGAVLVAC